MASVGDVALTALRVGVSSASRADFTPGEARSVAVDVFEDFAAVLVVRLRQDGAWILDLVRCLEVNGAWTDVGSGGGAYGDLPLDWDLSGQPGVVMVTTGQWTDGDRSFACAGGFVTGPVAEVELVTPIETKRVGIHDFPVFALVAPAPAEDDDLPRRHRWAPGPDVRAFDAAGNLVDDSAEWRREREAALGHPISVAEAIAAAPGTPVTVQGLLFVLPGHAPLLCDDVNDDFAPPRPVGATLTLPILTDAAGPPSWSPDTGALTMRMIVAHGVVIDGVLNSLPTNEP